MNGPPQPWQDTFRPADLHKLNVVEKVQEN